MCLLVIFSAVNSTELVDQHETFVSIVISSLIILPVAMLIVYTLVVFGYISINFSTSSVLKYKSKKSFELPNVNPPTAEQSINLYFQCFFFK